MEEWRRRRSVVSCECRGGREGTVESWSSASQGWADFLSQRQAQTFFHNAKHKHKLLLWLCSGCAVPFLAAAAPAPPSSESVGHADAAEEKPARRLPRAFHAAARQPSQ